MYTKLKIIVLFLLFFVMFACNQRNSEPVKKKENQERITVMVDLLNPQNYELTIDGIGTVDSRQRAAIIFETPGQLEKIYHGVGDVVTKGDIIAKIHSTTYRSMFELAEASYNKAQSDLEDAHKLLTQSAISNDEFNQLNLSMISTKANYVQAKERYEKCSLLAPFNGTIVDINLNLGEYISPGQIHAPPVMLADMQQLMIQLSISEREISQIQIGQDALIHIKAYENTTFYGMVAQVGLMTSIGSNSYTVKVNINHNSNKLKLGMIADVSIITQRFDEAMLIPKRYILEDTNGSFVFIDQDENAAKKYITVEDTKHGIAMVTGELKFGDLLITQGYQKVSSGSPLKVIN